MRVTISIILISIGLIACKKEVKKDEKAKTAMSNQTKTMQVDGIIARDELTTGFINTTGTIMANEEVEVKSEISGRITGLYFKEGSAVTKGQLLVKIDDADLQAQMNKLKIEIRLATEKESRQKQLLAASAISKEEYDVTQTSVSLLRANESILRTSIAKTKIVAPFSGIIGLKNVSPGAIISPTNIIATIQNVQPLKLEFNIPEKYNNLVTIGKVVDFKIAGNTEKLKASVYAKEPKIDEMTRTSRVRATFNNSGGKIYPGAFAEINVSIGAQTKVIMVPTIAYIPDISGAKLFIKKDGLAKSISVKAGIRTEKEIQILEGLEDGDTVITSGILQLKPKTPVEVNIVNYAQ
jgi:membrane fusion protein, multidrug efflux system